MANEEKRVPATLRLDCLSSVKPVSCGPWPVMPDPSTGTRRAVFAEWSENSTREGGGNDSRPANAARQVIGEHLTLETRRRLGSLAMN